MKKLILPLLFALLGGCASTAPAPAARFDHSLSALSQSSRVRFIIIHYTVSDLARSITQLTQKDVSAHYLLTDTPQPFFYALVDESRSAWQAGTSSWKNYTQLNNSSIGIEIVNPGGKDTPEGKVWKPFPQAQIDLLIPLLKDIVARHGVLPENILGHNEIAPQRRDDPGPLFPWKQLADAGLIPWPDAGRVAAQRAVSEDKLPDLAWFQQQLAQHGYATPQTGILDEPTRHVMSTFQMRYRQAKFDGVPDAETAALLYVINTTPPSASMLAPAVTPLGAK
ncbi:MAG TPA: N-acetylmuramoyl-L-alanine amidase [Janthinobacterium sp.]|nr:N-acetylmuramoyl-L-alanine amidase [Janthinobacterium sp.]